MSAASITSITSKFLTVDNAAAVMGVTPSRVRQMLRAGHLPGTRMHGKFWLVNRRGAEQAAKRRSKIGRPRGSKNL